MKQADVPNLWLLFGAYFNQDWQIDQNSPPENVRRFVENEPDSVSGARAELDLLLTSRMTEEELHELIVRRLHSFYDPTLLGTPMRAWLEEVRKSLS